MSTKRTREHTGSYIVVEDQGRRHTVHIFTDVEIITMLHGPVLRAPGLQTHKLANGDPVNVNDDGTVLDVRTGRTMRRLEAA